MGKFKRHTASQSAKLVKLSAEKSGLYTEVPEVQAEVTPPAIPSANASALSPGLEYVARKIIEQHPRSEKDATDAYKRLFPRGLALSDQRKVIAAVLQTVENRKAALNPGASPAVAKMDGRAA